MQDITYYSLERKDIFPFIPSGIKRTLDIGCASGNFSLSMKTEFGVEVWGIEMETDIAEIAKTKLDKVFAGSFDDVCDNLPEEYFDCIFFNDVLEHMPYPENCLEKIKKYLAEGGHIIASIPNVRYVGVLKDLLFKRDWRYQDSGVMDRTHLRFFTEKSIKRMFEDCGFEINWMKGTNMVSPYCLTSIINILLFNQIKDIKYRQYLILASVK